MAAVTSERSAYETLPATIEDAESIATMTYRSMVGDDIHSYFWPEERAHLSTEEEVLAWRLVRAREGVRTADGLAFKVVDPEDPSHVVGYAKWARPGYFADHTLEQSSVDGASSAQQDANQNHPPLALDFERQREFMKQLDEARREIWGDDTNYWYLAMLAVDPAFQCRGIGRKLLQFGIDRAAEDGVPMYLEGTKAGLFVYEKMGFKRVKDAVPPEGGCTLAMCVRPCDGAGK